MAENATLLSDARVVCASCHVAKTPWARLRGLMGKRGLEPGHGLLLMRSGSIHTCFMRFPIDVVFLDRDLQVLDVAGEVRPWRARARRGARAVLELTAGEAERAGIRAGQRLTLLDELPTGEQKEKAHVLC